MDEHYPHLAAKYAECSYAIQRADIARYLILHRHGGVYADLDMECLRPVGPLLHGRACVLTVEPTVHGSWVGARRMVSNAFMAVSPGHRFLETVIALLADRNLAIARHHEVLTSTGPLLLDEALSRHGTDDVVLLPAATFSPLASNDPRLQRLRDGRDVDDVRRQCLAAGAHGIHHWANSWVRALTGELVNPDPYDVPGFVFHPARDSRGHDIESRPRDVARLARELAHDHDVAGFNTDGFVKSRIRPRSQWERWARCTAGEGLYVKRAFHFGGDRKPGE